MPSHARVFLSAGEASGDAYGEGLVKRLRALRPDATFEAVGGRRLAASAGGLVADSSRWGAIGIIEALLVSPRVIRGYFAAKRRLAKGEPGLFIPIDFGFANIRLARFAKRLGWRVLYFVPPGSWRRDKQGGDLPAVTDAIVTPFSWSAEILRGMGANAHWFGHPLRELTTESGGVEDRVCGRLAALPGSRGHEIERHLIAIADSLPPTVREVEVAVAATADARAILRTWARRRPDIPVIVTESDTYGVLKRAEAAIVCSGTATLEAAICGCPMVVIYKASWVMELEYRVRRPKFDYFSLPNILLERKAVSELLQHDASPVRVRTELEGILRGPGREAQLAAFDELERILGPSDALTQAARLASQMLAQPTEPPIP
ncbi:MAG TPA: hypothetical protein PLL78_00705 [Fimbriimonadaceae bacterium]|nr:hypothetical protein [Fimbriimonadaceae bacterium]HRJ95182.1 hypothetical protein [Fimbriimonadaceae bacterium]